ncbi:Asp-tRNA(Asn)/Glu-tRNA(Gln) amidotransferase subunit GatB [Candidatus Falkowbacteria bacterium]|nr:Asp-tRNA(Asn)/Glu-tRNA(Gln) amidotransferase subunit GatB [Candidatus Falkowbacteria bacterium]
MIIGMEIHAELKTKSKMFCTCNNDSQGAEPNTNVCPICLGHPGTLPYPNKEAIEWTILLGLALNCKINEFSKFDRKNYSYPDLPKGYQISQFELPFCYQGYLEVNGEKIEITRIHLEEDTGKSMHLAGKDHSLIDLNRAGTPLIEMVTEPVIEDAETAKKFCQRYQQILRYLDISNADMEKGEMRCEANISIQEKGKWTYEDGVIKPVGGYKLNPKVELKNINSFKAVEKAINYEIERQKKALAEGEELIQETRGWNEDKGISVSQRAKETSADYRYFPEPDIPPVKISGQWIEEIRSKMVELPNAKKKRFIEEYNFSDENAEMLVSEKNLADYAEKVVSELRAWIDSTDDSWERQKTKLAKLTSNWLLSELFSHLNKDGKKITDISITPENFAELMTLVYQDKVNSSAGQKLLSVMYEKGGDPSQIMEDMGLEQLDNEEELEETIKEVLEKNPGQVEVYKSGKTAILQYFVGQTMAATKGKANPKKVAEILKRLLSN